MKTFTDELEEIFGPINSPEYAEARLAVEIALQFAALRKRRGLSQQQVAERLGKSQQAVSRIENPSHGGHNLSSLKAALEAIDATLDVTIVPLEDLEAYDACRPPKPALEDVNRRANQQASTVASAWESRRSQSRRNGIRSSEKIAPPVKRIAAEKKQPLSDQRWEQLLSRA